MDLTRQQELLARLATDTPFRRHFLASPSAVADALGLEPEGRAWLTALNREEVERYAASLLRKRQVEVAGLLPLTVQALGPRFGPLFVRHAERGPPRGPDRVRADALAFVAFLRTCRRDTSLHPIEADVACYEAAWLETGRPGRRLVVRWFRCPVRRVLDYLARGREFRDVPRRPCLVVWSRRRDGWSIFAPLGWPRSSL
jgi:hypothetical protein